jgi:hypothetical protein
MSRLFITPREIAFINDITSEFIKDLVGQKVYYYSVSEQKTQTHDVYNEAIDKVFDNPIEIEALVDQPENKTTIGLFGPERYNKLNVFFQYTDLVTKGINVSIGDFLSYGERFYEITTYSIMRNIYGEVEHHDGVKVECTQARESQIKQKIHGPTDIKYTEPDAVQTDFKQQRGYKKIDEKPTGDHRELQDSNKLEAPISGPASVKDGSFYNDR